MLTCSVILEKDLIVYITHLLSKVLIYFKLDYTKYEAIAILQKRPSNYLFGTQMPLTYIAQESTFPFGWNFESLFSLLRFVARHCENHFLLTCLPFMIIYLSGYNDWVKLAGNKKQQRGLVLLCALYIKQGGNSTDCNQPPVDRSFINKTFQNLVK